MGEKERMRGRGKENRETVRETASEKLYVYLVRGAEGERDRETRNEGKRVGVSGEGERRRKTENSFLKNNRCVDN